MVHRLLVFFLVVPFTLLPAQERDELLLRWILSEDPDPPADLVRQFASKEEVLAAGVRAVSVRQGLGPGFHRLETADHPHLPDAVILIPRHRREGGLPLMIGTPQGVLRPSDELTCRSAYGGWIDAGWAVLVPVSHWRDKGKPSWSALTDQGGALAALTVVAGTRVALDRDRVVLTLGMLSVQDVARVPSGIYQGETTPLAGCHLMLPGARFPQTFSNPGAWRGRVIALSLSLHAADETRTVAGALREAGVTVVESVTETLNWTGKYWVSPSLVESVAKTLRRGPWPKSLDAVWTGQSPHCGHEWLHLRQLSGPLRVTATFHQGDIELSTPDTPHSPLQAADIYLEMDEGAVRVTHNGRPAYAGSPPQGVTEALMVARFNARSGRNARRVLSLRP